MIMSQQLLYSTGVTPTTFRSFQRLLMELQLIVWRAAVQQMEPRTLEVTEDRFHMHIGWAKTGNPLHSLLEVFRDTCTRANEVKHILGDDYQPLINFMRHLGAGFPVFSPEHTEDVAPHSRKSRFTMGSMSGEYFNPLKDVLNICARDRVVGIIWRTVFMTAMVESPPYQPENLSPIRNLTLTSPQYDFALFTPRFSNRPGLWFTQWQFEEDDIKNWQKLIFQYFPNLEVLNIDIEYRDYYIASNHSKRYRPHFWLEDWQQVIGEFFERHAARIPGYNVPQINIILPKMPRKH